LDEVLEQPPHAHSGIRVVRDEGMILKEDARQALEVLRAGRRIDVRTSADDGLVLLHEQAAHQTRVGVESLCLRLFEVLDPKRRENLWQMGGARRCSDARVSNGKDELNVRDDGARFELGDQGLEIDRKPFHVHACQQPGRETGSGNDAACVLYQGATPRAPSI
jgi:hypothetical protein